jgi:hypothetical protein
MYDRGNPDLIGSHAEEHPIGKPLHQRSAETPMHKGKPEGILDDARERLFQDLEKGDAESLRSLLIPPSGPECLLLSPRADRKEE